MAKRCHNPYNHCRPETNRNVVDPRISSDVSGPPIPYQFPKSKSDVLSEQIDVPPRSGQGGGIRMTPGVEVFMFGFKDADPKRISIIEDRQNCVWCRWIF